tara:strand:+ start:3406 stop:4245 length:840 start_codon:yes stop_codon:yes gene_type:complete
MAITFTKMNSQGNEFILIDLAKEKCELSETVVSKIIKNISTDFDQLLLIDYEENSRTILCQIFNNDSSRAYQCGNGLRAIMLYLNSEYNYPKISVDIANIKYSVTIDDKKVITASMGSPRAFKFIDNNVCYSDSFEKQNVHINLINHPINFYLIDLGNKHCVIVDECTTNEKNIITDYFDNYHKNLLNIEFLDKPSDIFNLESEKLSVTVYEAGAGWTQSCGSGATAVASLFYEVHGELVADKPISIKQRGGELIVKKKGKDLLLSGPSTIEYEATINV